MLQVDERHQSYFDEVVEFAKKIELHEGGNDSLKRNLDYLANYAGGVDTKCFLTPDRPYGFSFAMYKKIGDEWKYWFNGGLLFHGSHDGFGSGQGPVFAVTASATNGWSIHT